MATLAVENYLKTILHLETAVSGNGGKPISTGSIAAALKVAPGTATAMIQTLKNSGLVRYRPYAGVHLTRRGRSKALHVLRRHRIVELFLVEVLGMSWTEVHEDAEALEHSISDRVLRRMDALLGHPRADPHGDPIPQPTGELPARSLIPLDDCAPGDRCVIARLIDQSPEFLQMAERNRLLPGAPVEVLSRDGPRQVLQIRAGRRQIAVSTSAASKIAVSRTPARAGRRRAGRKRRQRSS